MKPLLYYLLQVIGISAILYGYYHIALRNKKFHRYNRFYLLIAAIISILVPFLNIPVYFTQQDSDSSIVWKTLAVMSSSGQEENIVMSATVPSENWFTLQHILYIVYALVASLILLRVIFSLLRIKKIIQKNTIQRIESIHFVNTEEPGTPFSFFRWLFWNKKISLQSEKGEQIFRHELFHIEQKHSRDIIFIELLTVIFWINPFFHLMKKEIKAIHEFLADQFAIKENKQWEYAELLLMQAFGTHQHLVNPFFHNQIKRRITMITTSQKPRYQYLRKILVLPLAVIVAVLFAFSYKSKQDEVKLPVLENPFTVVIDAGHGGSDAGAKAADGTLEKNITLAIAKRIKELNDDKQINILLTRNGDNLPDLKSRVEFSNQHKADLFISLHVNATDEKNASEKNGVEVVISGKNKKYEPENKILSSILLNYFSQLLTTNMEIIQRETGIWVLDQSPCPAALIECGYLSNINDLAYIKNPENQDKMAKSILAGIDQYVLQSKMDDWQERKKVVSDTVKPDIKFIKNPSTGKLEGTYNGRKISHVNLFDNSLLVFDFENQDEIMLSEERSNEIRKKYGSDLEEIIKERLTPDKKLTDNKVFDKVEVDPAFPGGNAKWRMYLTKNLDASIAKKNKAPDGTYAVVVQFIVGTDGFISDVKALTKHGYGMEEEALRVIKNGPQWDPAIQNGKQVRAYKKQPITFVVGKGEMNFFSISKLDNRNDLKEKEIKEYTTNKITADPKPDFTVYNSTYIRIQGTDKVFDNVDPHILYIGISNSLKIESTDINIDKINATVSNGFISKEGNTFIVQPVNVKDEATVTFYIEKNGEKQELKKLVFKVRTFPENINSMARAELVTPKISTYHLKEVSPAELLNISPKSEILSYILAIDTDKGDIVAINNTGNEFNPATKEILNNASSGKLITIDYIKIRENGIEKKLPSKVYEIEN